MWKSARAPCIMAQSSMDSEALPSTLHTWLSHGDGHAALVFADILGSVLLVHGQGTQIYAHILSAYRSRAQQLVTQWDGRLISKEGDEIFVAFRSAVAAYRYGREMFEDAGHPLVTVRIGIHVGAVTSHDSGLVGRAVPYAQRVMDHAAAHELWLSDDAKRAIERESPQLADEIRWVADERCILKGFPEEQLLWRAG